MDYANEARGGGGRIAMANKNKEKDPSYIVGVGGSAGGLEAFGEFFSKMPTATGMAFVVVQHLDPTHKAMLAELLQRATKMPVVEIQDGMKVQPDTIYVIPPNKDVSVLHGVLQLLEPSAPRGTRLPIDFFFSHLAQDQCERAVGVILSGMGTDGTQGLKTIKGSLGMVMVQDPNSAKFDGMPRSAVATGMADYIAPAGELPAKLIDYTKHTATVAPKGTLDLVEQAPDALQKVLVLLRSQTGHDFSLYKKDMLNRRIKRRMDVHLIAKIDQYVRYLQENSQEIDLLFKELLIGVTGFFRDPQAFESLKEQVITHLLDTSEKLGILRAWVVGCSTGEEAYSIAIVLRECVETIKQKGVVDIQVFATDIDKDAIDVARRGLYNANIAADVSSERLQRFFVGEDNKYRLKKDIRDSVIFASHDLIMDPPFTKMDLVSCRNLLIYFSPELQKKTLPLLHYSLNRGGLLFLGPSETISGFTDLFSTLDNKSKVFQRKPVSAHDLVRVEFPSRQPAPPTKPAPEEAEVNLSDLVQRVLIESYSPPAVLVNEQGDILYISGRTGKYLEPSPGKVNWNVYAMAREGLRYEMAAAVRKAVAQDAEVVAKGIKVKTNAHEQIINLTVKPIGAHKDAHNRLLVIFQDVTVPQDAGSRKQAASQRRRAASDTECGEELRRTREHLQNTLEQMQSSREELQSTNEELQSANEELQSTNEELTSSKEELQSLNEELTTVNGELQSKVEQLSEAYSDIHNLLNSTQIATIFLDSRLKIKRFTQQSADIIKMIDSDIGRPIADLVSNLEDEDLTRDSQKVLDTLESAEKQVRTVDGRWYTVRMIPYRTLDNVIDGVVITFGDVSGLKQLEQSLTDERDYARSIIATVRGPLLVLNDDLRIVSASRSFYEAFQVAPEETEGKRLYDLGKRQWDIPELRKLLEEILPNNTEFNDFRVEHEFPAVGRKTMLLNARRIQRKDDGKPLMLLAFEDVTDRQGRAAKPDGTKDK